MKSTRIIIWDAEPNKSYNIYKKYIGFDLRVRVNGAPVSLGFFRYDDVSLFFDFIYEVEEV